ncbi:nucleoside-diphosphate-sugar epimerase GsfE [Penicillium daleae]|uniref:Nucleoside-diphosphate-sugar epimerase GsfE n=1 Tax=Penicillium daleae TaxID=63821 RepID=A0AAD6C3A1_9EURO|nr:nucleoside-diphosphate-sugar epimerase GsfE [Penicillium daleae]KAJ5449418.1 nucleoside-diphosphate-sugar epimerase GsfE [Penicillium daleae]
MVYTRTVVKYQKSPKVAFADPRIDFVAIDYLEPVNENINKLKLICADITHVFYTSYIHSSDPKLLPQKNVPLFKSFLDIMEVICPNIPHVGYIKPPAEEKHARYNDNSENFYYA